MAGEIRAIDRARIAELFEEADRSPRRRSHLLLHRDHSDEVQRLIVALNPRSYVRPHRHPEQWEMVTLMSGEARVLGFSEGGDVVEQLELTMSRTPHLEIAEGLYHTIVPLKPRTLILEVKPGPYRPAEFAAWAPDEGSASAPKAAEWLETALPGQSWRD